MLRLLIQIDKLLRSTDQIQNLVCIWQNITLAYSSFAKFLIDYYVEDEIKEEDDFNLLDVLKKQNTIEKSSQSPTPRKLNIK